MPDDYLVFIEEEDIGPVDDRLVLKVGGRHRHLSDLELQPDIDVELTNRGGALAGAGLVLALIGGIAALTACAMFLLYYPDQWRTGSVYNDEAFYTAVVGAIGGLVLIAGTILAPIGRRIQARGILRSVRVVEKPE